MRLRIALVLAALCLAAPAAAQTVAGRFVDADGAPIPSARVSLHDASGAAVHAALTGADGRFFLRAPAPGDYTVRGARIGYALTVGPALRLEAGPPVSADLVANAQRVMLEALVVEARPRCRARRDGTDETALVWEEIRKALDLVSAAAADRTAAYAVELFARERPLRAGSAPTEEPVRRVEGYGFKPFVTVDPARLASHGFIERAADTVLYAAPDAELLLSDAFLDTHCFHLRTDGAPEDGLIGLAFQPVRGRRLPDVQGVLWVNRATAELRVLDFEYTRPPFHGPRGVPGGRVAFQRLPDGRWVTSEWVIRMPVLGATTTVGIANTGPQVIAVREEGGTLLPAGSPARVAARPPPPAPSVVVDAAPPAADTVTLEARAAPAPMRRTDRARHIPRAEVEASSAGSAFSLIQRLRPAWLRARGNDGMRMTPVETRSGPGVAIVDESPIVVYVDGNRVGGLDALETIPAGDVAEVEYYDPVEAHTRWGAGHPQGAIHVITRR